MKVVVNNRRYPSPPIATGTLLETVFSCIVIYRDVAIFNTYPRTVVNDWHNRKQRPA